MTLDQEIAEEEALTQRFSADQARPSTSFAVPEHLNLVVPVASFLGAPLQRILQDIQAFPELTVSTFKNCHMTIAAMPAATDVQRIIAVTQKNLKDRPLSLLVQGVHLRPPGVFLNVYSPDQSLLKLRDALAAVSGTDFNENDRLANVGWITLARFKQPPSQDLTTYVRAKVTARFDLLAKAQPVLHRSLNSMQLGKVEWESAIIAT